MGTALSLRGVTKRFGDTVAVDSIDLDLGAHEVVALVGPSGCGKSTLLRVIAGLLSADEGTVRLGGELVDDGRSHVPPERRHLGLVFQEHALFPHLTVAANVGFGLQRRRRAEARRRIDEVLALVGLGRHGERYPHELSGGERQRVALARALAPEPSLLLLDEPFASLDPNLRNDVRAEVMAILRATDTPAVFVTHDQLEALAVGDRVAVMRAGRLAQLGDPYEVFHRPTNQFVARFMGEADFIPVAVRGARMWSELGESPVAGNVSSQVVVGSGGERQAVAMVRPDDVTFEVDEAGDAVVEAATFLGSAWRYDVRLASGVVVRAMRSHLVTVAPGTRVRASLMPGHGPVIVAPEG